MPEGGVTQGLADVCVVANHLINALKPFTNKNKAGKDEILKGAYRAIGLYASELFPRKQTFTKKTSEMIKISFKLPGDLNDKIERYLLAAVEDELPLRLLSLPMVSAFVVVYIHDRPVIRYLSISLTI